MHPSTISHVLKTIRNPLDKSSTYDRIAWYNSGNGWCERCLTEEEKEERRVYILKLEAEAKAKAKAKAKSEAKAKAKVKAKSEAKTEPRGKRDNDGGWSTVKGKSKSPDNKYIICSRAIRGVKCYNKKCTHAHTPKEFTPNPCRFSFRCKFIHTSCYFRHGKESKEDILTRIMNQ